MTLTSERVRQVGAWFVMLALSCAPAMAESSGETAADEGAAALSSEPAAPQADTVNPWHDAAAKAAAAAREKNGESPPTTSGATSPGENATGEKAGDKAADKSAKPTTDAVPAKKIFGAQKSAAPLEARAIGGYAKGCLAGAKALEIDGPAWQAMRLSRNRNWGHPKLIALVERFATEVQEKDGWPGLLVGDISQPRGGPMLTGHASHQVGLDADIWFTPMPRTRLSKEKRESLAATSMLASDNLSVNTKVWGEGQYKIIKRAASYPDVERVLVHPAIKKALCEKAGGDAPWLGKVRPIWGHFYHFHIRMGCPKDSPGCKPQAPPPGDSGCTKELDDWFKLLTAPPPKPSKPAAPVKPKPPLTLADLPSECRTVVAAGTEPASEPSGVGVPSSANADDPAAAVKPPAAPSAAPAPPATKTGSVAKPDGTSDKSEKPQKPRTPKKSAAKAAADPEYSGPKPQ
ncbi:MAG: penicillin-insensitive murein endopeptidase [Hyphomicrobium sp.]|nr:penicillin-insensitive murein endopeptidase [Hyphomicrobium sp.]